MPMLSSLPALYTVQGNVIQSARVSINLISMTSLNLLILHRVGHQNQLSQMRKKARNWLLLPRLFSSAHSRCLTNTLDEWITEPVTDKL